MANVIRVQEEDFDHNSEYDDLRQRSTSPGAIVTFTGLVRELSNNQAIVAMELEHYPGMTEKSLQQIIEEAGRRWEFEAVTVIHRVGRLLAGDQIVFVGVSSPHRREAFAACEFIMDFLKTRAPFWKKEYTPGGAHWVEAKDSDSDAASRWGK